MATSDPPDVVEMFASFHSQDSILLESISTDEPVDSVNEVEIVKELKASLVPHQCDLCCEGNFLVNKLLQFGGVFSDSKKHCCEICCQGFVSKRDLSQHIKLHETGMLNSDSEIEAERNHRRRASSKATFICDICTAKFKHKRSLLRHMAMKHQTEISYTHKCEVCMATFKNFNKFTRHCLLHTTSNEKLLSCCTCNKKFLWKKNLLEHICKVN